MARICSWMKNSLRTFTDEKIIPYVFTLSDGPMLFRDLLRTNKMYQEGLKLALQPDPLGTHLDGNDIINMEIAMHCG